MTPEGEVLEGVPRPDRQLVDGQRGFLLESEEGQFFRIPFSMLSSAELVAPRDEPPDVVELFHAWQSDYKPARNQITGVLRDLEKDAATWGLRRPFRVIEAVAPGDGAVRIDAAILEKIKASAFFLGDVTPITVSEGKLYPNANVLIETGYALAAMDPESIFLVEAKRTDEGAPTADPGARFPFDIDKVHRYVYQQPADLKKRLREALLARLAKRGWLRAV